MTMPAHTYLSSRRAESAGHHAERDRRRVAEATAGQLTLIDALLRSRRLDAKSLERRHRQLEAIAKLVKKLANAHREPTNSESQLLTNVADLLEGMPEMAANLAKCRELVEVAKPADALIKAYARHKAAPTALDLLLPLIAFLSALLVAREKRARQSRH